MRVDMNFYQNVRGIRVDYVAHFTPALCYGFELSRKKLMPESQFLDYWEYNRKALLTAYEQILFGIRGTVTNSFTGKGLPAKVLINDNNTDSTHFYSNMPQGDFCRPIFRGTYSLTFISKGYHSKKIEDVRVENKSATVLDVKLIPVNSYSAYSITPVRTGISIVPCNGRIKISYPGSNNLESVTILDLSGREIWSSSLTSCSTKNGIIWNVTNNTGQQVSSGCYLVGFRTKDTFQICRFAIF